MTPLLGFVFAALFATSLSAQTNSIQEACMVVGMDCGYNSRYDVIDTIYKASGQVMFDQKSNPYTREMSSADVSYKLAVPRFYIGTSEQNAKLARNIVANKGLFKNGKLTNTAAKKWKLVN